MKTLFALLLVLLASPAGAAPKVAIKLATVAPSGTTWVNELEKTNRDLEAKSGGEVGFRIYAGGVLGDEADVVRKIRIGQVQAAAFTGMGLGELQPEVRVLEIPFFAKTDGDVDHLTERLFDRLEKSFAAKKFVLLGFVPVGFVYLFSESPIRSIEELRRVKAWVWEGDPLAQGFLKAAGVAGIPLSLPDVLTSLQTGLINTVYGTPLGVIALQWHTKVKWRMDLPITHATGGIVVAQSAFARLDPKVQVLVKSEVRNLCGRLTESSRKEAAESLSTLESGGVKTAVLDAAARDAFLALGPKVAEAYVGKLYPRDLLDLARRAIETTGAKPAK